MKSFYIGKLIRPYFHTSTENTRKAARPIKKLPDKAMADGHARPEKEIVLRECDKNRSDTAHSAHKVASFVHYASKRLLLCSTPT